MSTIFAGKMALQWLVAGASLTSVASVLTIVAAGHGNLLGLNSEVELHQNYAYDEMDAIEACRVHSQEKFDNKLLHAYVDTHSTRFEEAEGVYLVVLNGHIGTRKEYDEATIYCNIRPQSNNVTYFRAYDSDNRSLQSGMGFTAFKHLF